MTPPLPRLPEHFRIALDPDVRRLDGGTALVGGSPLRLLRLTEAGARLVDRLAAGEPVGAAAGAQRLAKRLLDAGIAHPRPGTTALTRDDVTVVVPVRDRPAELSATLARIGPTGAVVVVDDGSAATAATAAAARQAGALLLSHERPRGPAAARNTGAEIAATELVAFVDADCEPEAGWLDAILPHFGDPSVAAVGPRITTLAGPGLPRWLAAYEAARSPLDRGAREGAVRPASRVPFLPSAALVVRRDALAAIGGFDEALRVGEDVDLVWRLVDAGWTVRYEPAAAVAHPARPTPGAWVRQRFDYGTSAAPLARRHGAAVAPLAVSAWSAASWTLIGLGFPCAGAALAGATAPLLARRLRDLRHPWREAGRLAAIGQLHAGRSVADAVRRAWWPLAVPAALVSRRARAGVLAAATVPLLVEWARERPGVDPVRWLALRLADDLAYGAGVWAGCGRERSAEALRPDLTRAAARASRR